MKYKLFFICLVSLLLIPSHALAKSYPIEWEPKRIELTMGLGDTQQFPCDFTCNIPMTDADLWIVPELQPFVTLDATHFENIQAGTTHTVNLTISIPYGTQTGVYDGTIHMRGSSATHPQTMKVELNVVDAAETISPEGGVVEVSDPASPIYGVKIEIPEQAFSGHTLVSVNETTFDIPVSEKEETVSITPSIRIQPENVTLGAPCTITIPYDDVDNDGIVDGTDFSERFLIVLFLSNDGSNEILRAEDYVVDTVNNTISISSYHFSMWKIIG